MNLDTNHYKKYKLSTAYLEAPVELRYSSNPEDDKRRRAEHDGGDEQQEEELAHYWVGWFLQVRTIASRHGRCAAFLSDCHS